MKIFAILVLSSFASFAAKPPQPSYISATNGTATDMTVNGTLSGAVTFLNIGDRNDVDSSVLDPASVGGSLNSILGPYSDYSAIFGGSWNTINPNTQSAAIVGGDANTVGSGIGSTIVGGLSNTTLGDSYNCIAGGSYNTISLNVGWSAIVAGDSCTIDGPPGSDYSTILGGYDNSISAKNFAHILGGVNNTVYASEAWAIGSDLNNGIPQSVQIGFGDRKVIVTPTAVTVVGVPLIMQDASGGTFTRIWTQNGVIHSEAYTP